MASLKTIPGGKQEQERFTIDKVSLANKNVHLSIEVRENSIIACLLDKDTNQYLAWSSYNRKDAKGVKRSLDSILKEEMLNIKCSSSSVVFTEHSAMLIPSSFFSQDSVRDYLKQQNLIKPGETPCSDFIKNNDCYSVYSVDTDEHKLLKERYPQAAFRHHSSVFVEYLLALHKDSTKNEVHVYVFDGYMDVVALQAGKLILYNRYAIQTANDFTYFLLWVYEELKLKPEDSSCFFYGDITEKSEMFTLVLKYLKNVRIAEKTSRFTFSSQLDSLPAQAYYSLFMQYLCI
jgi:hypothetical protein